MTIEQYKKEIKDYCDVLKENIKQEFSTFKTIKENKVYSKKTYSAAIPLPRDITIEERIEMIDGSYCVIFDIKCGLRNFITQCYLGTNIDTDIINVELKRAIENAIQQCLRFDKGQISEVSDSGKIVNIQSL